MKITKINNGIPSKKTTTLVVIKLNYTTATMLSKSYQVNENAHVFLGQPLKQFDRIWMLQWFCSTQNTVGQNSKNQSYTLQHILQVYTIFHIICNREFP